MKEVFGLLDDEARNDIKQITDLANRIWGNNCEFGQLKVQNSPYAEFEWPLCLYHKVDVTLTYDRSILGIAIKTQKGNVWVDDLTNEIIYDGFESSKPENILHNFQVLDEVIRKMIAKSEV